MSSVTSDWNASAAAAAADAVGVVGDCCGNDCWCCCCSEAEAEAEAELAEVVDTNDDECILSGELATEDEKLAE
jgi:hypothetical protein